MHKTACSWYQFITFRPHAIYVPIPPLSAGGGPPRTVFTSSGTVVPSEVDHQANWHSPAQPSPLPKIIKDPHQKVVLLFFVVSCLYWMCCELSFDAFLMGTWCAFYRWWFLQVFSCWCGMCWYCLIVLLGGCFCSFLMLLKLWLKSLWHVTFFIGLPHPNTKHANPTSRSDQSYPLTLATNLVEPEFLSLRSLSGNITCKSGTMNHGTNRNHEKSMTNTSLTTHAICFNDLVPFSSYQM